MTKFTNRIMRINFHKRFKQLIIAAVCLVLLGGGLSAFLLREQIGEAVASVQTWYENRDDPRYEIKEESSAHGADGKERRREQEKENDDKDEGDVFAAVHLTRPSVAAKVTVGVTGLLYALVAALYWLLVAAWLYKAAAVSGMNGLLWALLGACGNLFAVILFHLARSFKRKKCPFCGRYVAVTARYCAECGTAFFKKCPACGGLTRDGDKFCPCCGKAMPPKA